MTANDTLRWGILSTARIGREHVIPALQASVLGEVVAIASRDVERARGAAGELGIARAHGSYEALLADDGVDAIYNPLPNHLHVGWSVRALRAGKHVLCEKPLGLDAADAGTLLDAARAHPGLTAMEAFMYRFHPQWDFVLGALAGGRIGRLQAVHAVFTYHKDDPDDIRNVPQWGGGGLLDIGCYGISVARLLFGGEPRRVAGTLEFDPRYGTDMLCSGLLEFEGGVATFLCGTRTAPFQRVTAIGSAGRIEVEVPFNPPPDRPARVRLRDAHGETEWRSEVVDQYAAMGDAFARAALHGAAAPTPLEDAVANMRVIDAVGRSARSGERIALG